MAQRPEGYLLAPLEARHAARCDEIVAALPAWFGNAEGIRQCAEAVRTQDGFVSLVDDRQTVAGFITWQMRFPQTAEITWLAIDAAHHRHGHGTALVDAVFDEVVGFDVRLLVVHTLSAASPDPFYARTRRFWESESVRFIPAAERPELWGPENPALMLVRPTGR
jgi:ribosomal protein S18 acetylase RimI-like enzyme